MEISVNGKTQTIEAPLTVAQFLETLGLAGRRVALELNREIVPRNSYDSVRLKTGDSLEIIHFVGGG